jgi:hypothetical protein
MMGLLKNPAAAAAIGAAARQVTQDQRGASARHAEIVLAAMDAGKTVGALPAVISPGAL